MSTYRSSSTISRFNNSRTIAPFEIEEEFDLEVHPYSLQSMEFQIERLNKVRETRDPKIIQTLLEQLKTIALDESKNILPITIELVKAGASMGDIVETLKTVWGTYRETPVF